MRTATSKNGAAQRHSGDLRHGPSRTFNTWLERHRLATLAFQAVADAAWLTPRSDVDRAGAAGMPCEKMLVLITYCYATGVYDSAEIAACIPRDAVLREICAGTRPTAESVRQFRWTHSEVIIRALSRVLRRAREVNDPSPS